MSKRPGSRRRRIVIALILVVTALASGGVYVITQQNEPTAAALTPPEQPTFRSSDGSAMLTVPDGAMEDNTSVDFQKKPDHAASIADIDRFAFKAIASPVDITVKTGKLADNKVAVTLAYDPAQIPQGLGAKQVGMMMYDTNLETWVPLLGAEADAKTNTVTAIAPHFSEFVAMVLDPFQKAVNVVGKTIDTAIDNTVTVVQWTGDLLKKIIANVVDDLFGIAPSLNCAPTSARIGAATKSAFNRLTGCVQTAGNNDRLRLRNGFAFPMLTQQLPTGMKLEMNDVWDNGQDLADLVRSLYWTTQSKAYVSGASLASVTITPEMKQSATLTMDLDSDALAFDIGLAVLSVIVPLSSAAKLGVKNALQAALRGEKPSGDNWLTHGYDMLDCIVGASHQPVGHIFTRGSTEAAADTASSCLSTMLAAMNIEGAVGALLGGVKTIPATIQAVIYSTGNAVLESLPDQFGKLEADPPTATVTRKQLAGKSLVGDWYVHGAKLVIQSYGPGVYTWSAGPCTMESDETRMCIGRAKIDTKLLPNGELLGTWDKPVYTDDDGNRVTPSNPEPMEGRQFRLEFTDDPNIIKSVPVSGSDMRLPGNPYLCSKTAMEQNDTPKYQRCGA